MCEQSATRALVRALAQEGFRVWRIQVRSDSGVRSKGLPWKLLRVPMAL